jgi:16S rRNA processing protein RimM
MTDSNSNTSNNTREENNLKYLGIISSVNPQKNQIILSDFPPNLPDIHSNFLVKIGFSVNFTQDFKATEMTNFQKFLAIELIEKITTANSDNFIRKAVYTDISNLLKEKSDLILPEDILGLQVIDEKTGNVLGFVRDVMLNPANQVWLVENDEYELPIPYTPNVVKQVDLKAKTVLIELIDGLLELAELKNAPKKERVFKKRGTYKNNSEKNG